LWAQLGLWPTESERLFPPKETLRTVPWEAEFVTLVTSRLLRRAANNEYRRFIKVCRFTPFGWSYPVWVMRHSLIVSKRGLTINKNSWKWALMTYIRSFNHLILIGLALFGLSVSSAHAALVTELADVDINGTFYDVTFHTALSFNDLWDGDGNGDFGADGSIFDSAPTFWGTVRMRQ
jgi:hypothetical protein